MNPYIVCTNTPPALNNKIQVECTGLTGNVDFSYLSRYTFNAYGRNFKALGYSSIPLDGSVETIDTIDNVKFYSTETSGENGNFSTTITIIYKFPYRIVAPNLSVTFNTPVRSAELTVLRSDDSSFNWGEGVNMPSGINSIGLTSDYGEFDILQVDIYSMPNAGERFVPGNIYLDKSDIITADKISKCELTEQIDLSLQEQPFNELNVEFDNTDRREIFDYKYYYLVDNDMNYGCFSLFEKNNLSSSSCSLKFYDITNKFIKESDIGFIEDVDVALWLSEPQEICSVASFIIEDSISTELMNTTVEVETKNFTELALADVGTARPETSLLLLGALQNKAIINCDRDGKINIIKEPTSVTDIKKHISSELIMEGGFEINEEYYSGVSLATNFIRYIDEENKAMSKEHITFADRDSRIVLSTETSSSGYTQTYYMECYYTSSELNTGHAAEKIISGTGYAVFAPYNYDKLNTSFFGDKYYYVPYIGDVVTTTEYVIEKKREDFKSFDVSKEISCDFISNTSYRLSDKEPTQYADFEYSADEYLDYLYRLYIDDKETVKIANFDMVGDYYINVGDNIGFNSPLGIAHSGVVTSLNVNLKTQGNITNVEVFCS